MKRMVEVSALVPQLEIIHKIVWHCISEIRNERWHEEYKMSWTSFNILCNLLRSYVQKQVTHYRDPIEVERVVAIDIKILILQIYKVLGLAQCGNTLN